jgi:hypothetical protein
LSRFVRRDIDGDHIGIGGSRRLWLFDERRSCWINDWSLRRM